MRRLDVLIFFSVVFGLGQLWAFKFITRRIFEVSWGTGNSHFYVSCGVGSWGPPVRIGNTPEIMHITLTFS